METEATSGTAIDARPADPPPAVGALLAAACVTALVASVWAGLTLRRRIREGRPVVAPRPHAAVPWSGVDVAVVFATYCAGMGLAGYLLPQKPPLADTLFAGLVVSLTATLAGAAWLGCRGATLATLGFAGRRWREDFALACAGLALVLAPVLALAGLLDRLLPYRHPIVDYLRGQQDAQAIGLVVLSAVVTAPLTEEFFFRRVLQGWLERIVPAGDPAPVVVSALAFGLAHHEHGLAWVPLTLLGIVLGVIAQRTGSIVPCIILHALFNAVSVILLLVQVALGPAAG